LHSIKNYNKPGIANSTTLIVCEILIPLTMARWQHSKMFSNRTKQIGSVDRAERDTESGKAVSTITKKMLI
jgi:hypothetical protein